MHFCPSNPVVELRNKFYSFVNIEGDDNPINECVHQRIYHLVLWTLFLLLSCRLFTIETPGLPAWLLSLVTLASAVISFYVPGHFPMKLRSLNYRIPFIAGLVAAFLIVISWLRTIGEWAIYHLYGLRPLNGHFMSFFWTSLVLNGFIILVSVTVRVAQDSYHEKKRWESINKERLTAELAYLKSQLHPHFLFNIHSTIFFLINKDPALASKMLLQLSDIIRYCLYECEGPEVKLVGELKNISDYLELEQIRLGNKVKIDVEFAGTDKDVGIAPFILLPLVENAVKHGSGFIWVCCNYDHGNLSYTVENAYEKSESASTSGIGLYNLQRRLALIYFDKYKLEIDPNNSIFTVKLMIRL
jgi:two-component system, LytTR family, sensor kinase